MLELTYEKYQELETERLRLRPLTMGDAVPAAVHGREAPFEFSDFFAVEASPVAAAERPQQPRLFRVAKDRPRREGLRADRRGGAVSLGKQHPLGLIQNACQRQDCPVSSR